MLYSDKYFFYIFFVSVQKLCKRMFKGGRLMNLVKEILRKYTIQTME